MTLKAKFLGVVGIGLGVAVIVPACNEAVWHSATQGNDGDENNQQQFMQRFGENIRQNTVSGIEGFTGIDTSNTAEEHAADAAELARSAAVNTSRFLSELSTGAGSVSWSGTVDEISSHWDGSNGSSAPTQNDPCARNENGVRITPVACRDSYSNIRTLSEQSPN